MSKPVFAKVILRVLCNDCSEAENLRDEADAIDVDSDDESDSNFDEKLKKAHILMCADKLDAEPLPSVEEIYAFMSEKESYVAYWVEGSPVYISKKTRFEHLIECCACAGYGPTSYSHRLFVKNNNVFVSFVTQLNENKYPYDSIENMETELNDEDPLFKSKVGGQVGNFCKFPSRDNKENLLGEICIDATVTRVTDLSGKTEWEEPESDATYTDSDDESTISESSNEVGNPVFQDVDLDSEVCLDDVILLPKKRRWARLSAIKKLFM